MSVKVREVSVSGYVRLHLPSCTVALRFPPLVLEFPRKVALHFAKVSTTDHPAFILDSHDHALSTCMLFSPCRISLTIRPPFPITLVPLISRNIRATP
jgi:hypothetical protein